MKCGPDECPIRVFSDLTPAEQRVERKRTVVKMAEQGFTQVQIAKQLGISQQTVSLDLGNLPIVGKLKQAKTPGNPKGAGRPRGKPKPRAERAPQAVEREEKIAMLKDAGLKTEEIAVKVGLGVRAVNQALEHIEIKREAEAVPIITPDMLSKTAQEKNEAWRRQEKARLQSGFHAAVNARVQEFLEETILPKYRLEQERYRQLSAIRKGIMDKATFKLIWSALHPDSRKSISDKKLAEAFDAFSKVEKLLLDEKNSPTEFQPLPKTMADWDRMKAAAAAKRASKRNNSTNVKQYSR